MIQHAAKGSCLTDHPALEAWSEIAEADFARPEIEVLKDRRASHVYRLVGLGPGGSNVIAKRYPESNALAEYRIYKEVLCHLPVISLRHYGLVKEKGTGFCWAFIEDASGEPYSPAVKQHTVEAAIWLAVLHTSALEVTPDLELPDRGPRYYLDCLNSGRARIRLNLTSPFLSEDDRIILAILAAQCDAMEAKWEWIEGLCRSAPQTFVHADLHAANIHVRTNAGGIALVPFDWEAAGRGAPAIDLALEGVDLAAYCSIVRGAWPELDAQAVRALSNAGRIFQLLELVAWESKGLDSESLWRRMKHMRHYQSELSRAIEAVGGGH